MAITTCLSHAMSRARGVEHQWTEGGTGWGLYGGVGTVGMGAGLVCSEAVEKPLMPESAGEETEGGLGYIS